MMTDPSSNDDAKVNGASLPRACPFCNGPAGRPTFPFATSFAGASYYYFGCKDCGTSYIDPLPDAATFALMYAPAAYHDVYYSEQDQDAFRETTHRLAAHLPKGSRILDFGCGTGHLIGLLAEHGYYSAGAEFSCDAAKQTASRTGRPVFDLTSDCWQEAGPWDCIHLGDVIEHIPEPIKTLKSIVSQLPSGGFLSAEGPLETNASLVLAAVRTNDWFKRHILRQAQASFAPYHLTFTDAHAQYDLFMRLGVPLVQIHWEVYETGWPYRGNGSVRNAIAQTAVALSSLPVIGRGLGNRFRAIFHKD